MQKAVFGEAKNCFFCFLYKIIHTFDIINHKKQTMASTSETGHAKNIANFQDLISFCQGYGVTYNPTKESLKISELQIVYQTSSDRLNDVKINKTAFDNSTNERRNAFENLKPLATKIINAFTVSGADKLAVDDAKSINKKLQGTRATPQVGTTTDPNISASTISTSQQSYDRQIDHLANLIQVLEQNPIYNPNEIELKVTSLQTKLADLQTKNTNLINSYTQYSNAMINRNQTLYNPLSGLLQTAKEVKLYVKSIFGATSPQFKQVSGLEFTKPR
jgi:hypothetical protein